MTIAEAARAVRNAQSAVISHYARFVHAQYILTLEALINRYKAHLWIAYDDAFQRVGASPFYETHIVKDLQEIGHGYIAIAAALGYERALRDLVLTGYIKWYSQPVKAPFGAYKDALAYNDKYLADSFGPDLKQTDPTAMRPRLQMYSHYLWRVAEAAYKYALKQYRAQIGISIRESMREQDDEDDGDFAAVFAGPDDDETCDGCDEAVNDNPYTVDTVPDPGSFECMSRCRHFVQLAQDAPDDLAPYEWHGLLGFGSVPGDYYEGVVRDQDLLPRWQVDERRFDQSYAPSTDGIALPHLGSVMGDLGLPEASGRELPASYDILSDQLAPALQMAQEGKTEDLAQWLWDSGLAPATVKEWIEQFLDYDELRNNYNDIQDESATTATVLTWIRRGETDRLIDVLDNPQFLSILAAIASQGFPAADSFAATVVSEVLGITAEFVSATNRWTFDISSLPPITESVREVGGPGSGDYGHAGNPPNVGGSAPGGGRARAAHPKMMTLYHVTRAEYVQSILKQGLIPQIGALSQAVHETEARVYFFHDLHDVEFALDPQAKSEDVGGHGGWMVEPPKAYPPDTKLSLLQVTVPVSMVHQGAQVVGPYDARMADFMTHVDPNKETDYEWVSERQIPPEDIKVLSSNVTSITPRTKIEKLKLAEAQRQATVYAVVLVSNAHKALPAGTPLFKSLPMLALALHEQYDLHFPAKAKLAVLEATVPAKSLKLKIPASHIKLISDDAVEYIRTRHVS